MFKTRIEVSGFNLPRLLFRLASSGITATDVRRNGENRATFCIYTKECRKTFAILKKMCYNYRIVESDTLFSLVKNAAKRCGYLFGFAAFCCFAYFCSNFVLGVKTDCESEECAADVLKAADDTGTAFGFLSDDEISALKGKVLALEAVTDAQVSRKGNYLFVSVLERSAPHREAQRQNVVVSKRDAAITKVVVNSGFAAVRAGDRVFEGAPLIVSERQNADGTTSTAPYASGTVYGEVVYRKSIYAPAETKTTVYSLPTADTRISFGDFFPDTENADYEIRRGVFDIFLPVRVTKTTVRRKSVVAVKESPDEIAARELDAFELSLGYADISEKRYSVVPMESGYLIDLYLKRNEIIT